MDLIGVAIAAVMIGLGFWMMAYATGPKKGGVVRSIATTFVFVVGFLLAILGIGGFGLSL